VVPGNVVVDGAHLGCGSTTRREKAAAHRRYEVVAGSDSRRGGSETLQRYEIEKMVRAW
jgi:hypothetical protein